MDRITTVQIESIVQNLSRITGLNYKYDTNMRWHTLYCENSRICSANTKGSFYALLSAIQSQLYTLERTGIMTKRS